MLGLEWDPLSNEYLLIARAEGGVSLVDTDSVTVIQQFSLPSAAAQVQTIAWISNAPGMFVTGGKMLAINQVDVVCFFTEKALIIPVYLFVAYLMVLSGCS